MTDSEFDLLQEISDLRKELKKYDRKYSILVTKYNKTIDKHKKEIEKHLEIEKELRSFFVYDGYIDLVELPSLSKDH